jgi:hypothetical protein
MSFLVRYEERSTINGAGSPLFPIHAYNTAAAAVSVLSLWMWIFLSPHNHGDTKKHPEIVALDTACFSFFACQYIGSVMQGLFSMLGYSCGPPKTPANVLFIFLYIIFSLGVSIVGTNILSHRYLLVKARIMTVQIAGNEDARHGCIASLGTIEGTLKYEFRAFLLASVAAVLNTVSAAIDSRTLEKASFAVAAALFVPVLLIDSVASVQLTTIFLRPVVEALRRMSARIRHASMDAPLSRMQRRKWATLIGSTLAVTSSTLLYLNIFPFLLRPLFYDDYGVSNNEYANPVVFGVNIDAIMNNLGMLVACGFFSKVPVPCWGNTRDSSSSRRLALEGTDISGAVDEARQPQPPFAALPVQCHK